GGTLISKFRMWPAVTASRCSIIASMCQPATNGVEGSTIGHAWRTNSRRLRAANSQSISVSRFGLANKSAQQFEFFIGQFGEVRPRFDSNGRPARTAVLVAEVVFVTQQILGKEDGGGDI